MNINEPRTAALMMTITDVCSELRLGQTKVYELLKRGRLDSVRIGSARRITRASVERLIRDLHHEASQGSRQRPAARPEGQK